MNFINIYFSDLPSSTQEEIRKLIRDRIREEIHSDEERIIEILEEAQRRELDEEDLIEELVENHLNKKWSCVVEI